MKKYTIIFIFLLALGAQAQDKTKIYGSFASEMIFSFATIDNQGYDQGNIMRWAPVLNLQGMLNVDFNNTFGLFTGAAIRNVGFIYENPLDTNDTKFKYRTYNFGIPVGFKIGKLDKFLFFGGYEIEFPFVYKEKTFDDGDKIDKITGWFSNRTENFQHGVFAGIQFPEGINLKFKYYFSEFHNQDFMESSGVKPYAGLESHVFYFSLSYAMFQDVREAYDY